MTKQIIRIEHSDGKGLFRSPDETGKTSKLCQHSKLKEIIERHSDDTKFPTFFRDYELRSQIQELREDLEDYYFAFHSLEVLNEALTPDELKEAIEVLGFKVYIFEVSLCIESQYQVMFKKEHVVNQKDISFMFI